MKIKILGICGSPIKQGNTEAFLREAMEAAGKIDGVDTELIALAGKNIQDCIHCNWCLRGQKEGSFCRQEYDMSGIYPALLAADGLLLASPVYVGRLSGYLASFIDRLRVFMHGNYYKERLKDKAAGALAVGWRRDGGGETALLSINYAFLRLGMLVAQGASGVSSLDGTGGRGPDDRHLVLKDKYGLNSAHRLAGRMVELIRIVKPPSLSSGTGLVG